MNVSRPAVQRAAKVLKHGDDQLTAAVQSGDVTVSAAAQRVAIVTRYPELGNIHRLKGLVTIAKNLDALPEEQRIIDHSNLLKNDSATLTRLAEKPPLPPAPPRPLKSGCTHSRTLIIT